MYDILRACFAHIIFSERKSRDITTKTHLSASSWHDHSVLACWFVSGCMEAFLEVNSIEQGHKAYG